MSKKVLLAVMVDDVTRTTIEGCMIVDMPTGQPPFSAPDFESAQRIKFDTPIPHTENSAEDVINKLRSMGIDCELTQFSG